MASTFHWHLGCENLNLKTFHLSFGTWILFFVTCKLSLPHLLGMQHPKRSPSDQLKAL